MKNPVSSIFICAFWGMFLMSCSQLYKDRVVDKSTINGNDYRLFQGTSAWTLAKAVWTDNESEIRSIVRAAPNIINFQEPKYGSTLLMMTIRNKQYKTFVVLLENKANYEIHDTYDGTSALIDACNCDGCDIRFAQDLISNGANVNDIETGKRRSSNSTRYTPLIAGSQNGRLDLVELLINAGADVNYKNEFNQSALSEAVLTEKLEVVLYLLKHGADYRIPVYYSYNSGNGVLLVEQLRKLTYDLNSARYDQKQAIIAFLRTRGIEYNEIPVPSYMVKKIQKKYPNNWKDYINKY